ncbi:MAG: GNAT family N-acetyltransferase [Phototrophicaceae bacterium]|jgi:ribosomal-protein-alanine N-acetyltransferase
MAVPARYQLRYMRLSDVPIVTLIDQQSFPIPWSSYSYTYELRESEYSHLVVVERLTSFQPPNRLQRWWQHITRANPPSGEVLSYGGLWVFEDNGHISTIASNPSQRGQGWGELALLAMLRRAANTLPVTHVTLEVRETNTTAQALYHKYGFIQRGLKEHYYHDNGEHALDMVMNIRDPQWRTFIERRYREYQAKYPVIDSYTQGQKPK